MSEKINETAGRMKLAKLTVPGADDFFVQEAFKALRTNIQFCGQDKKVIFITSCEENEGKTTIVLQIAKSFAELGRRVLVLDADMRKSVMATRDTSAKDNLGLSEVLTGQSSFGDCLYAVEDIPKLHILFSGTYPPNPVELLNHDSFVELVTKLRKSYDYIFIDTPPLGVVIDAAVIAPCCDGGLLVLNQNAHYKQAKTVAEQINKSGSKLLGVIRNRSVQKKHSYYKRKKK